jgi:predicted ester cyclase
MRVASRGRALQSDVRIAPPIGHRRGGAVAVTAQSKRSLVFLLMEIVNGGDLSVLDEACHPDLVWQGDGGSAQPGLDAFRRHLAPLLDAVADLTIVVDDLLVDGDHVACRFGWTGLHRGPYRDLAPSGRHAMGGGLAIFRVEQDRIAEVWWQDDLSGLTDLLRAPSLATPGLVLVRSLTDAA